MKLALSFVKFTVTTATAMLTTGVGLFVVRVVHKQHTTQIPTPPTNEQTASVDLRLLLNQWLYLHTTLPSFKSTSDASIPHIGGTIHEKTTTEIKAKPKAPISSRSAKPDSKVGKHTQSSSQSSSHKPPQNQQAQRSQNSTQTHTSGSSSKSPPKTSPGQQKEESKRIHVPSIPARTVFAYVPDYAKSTSLADIMHHRSSFSEIGDWSFSLQQGGRIHGEPNQSLLEYANRHGMHVYLSISDNYNQKLAASVLTSASARQRLTQQLVQLSKDYHYTGVNLDIENIAKSNRREFSSFVSHLDEALHSQGKLLTLAVPAIDTSAREGGYDLASLGTHSDGLIIMAYDYTYLTQPPGPIAPLSWAQRVLTFNLHRVPANKLILGVGAYGYDWGGAKAKSVSEKTADHEVAAEHMVKEQNAAFKTPYYTYTDKSGDKHIFYYETSSAVKQLIDLAKVRHLRGIALWHAGDEDDVVAASLKTYR